MLIFNYTRVHGAAFSPYMYRDTLVSINSILRDNLFKEIKKDSDIDISCQDEDFLLKIDDKRSQLALFLKKMEFIQASQKKIRRIKEANLDNYEDQTIKNLIVKFKNIQRKINQKKLFKELSDVEILQFIITERKNIEKRLKEKDRYYLQQDHQINPDVETQQIQSPPIPEPSEANQMEMQQDNQIQPPPPPIPEIPGIPEINQIGMQEDNQIQPLSWYKKVTNIINLLLTLFS